MTAHCLPRLAAVLPLGLALLLGCGNASAQAWPSRPVKFVAPFPPGGPVDLLARLIGQKISEKSGQPVLVENKPGAAGNLGIEQVAKCARRHHLPACAGRQHKHQRDPDARHALQLGARFHPGHHDRHRPESAGGAPFKCRQRR